MGNSPLKLRIQDCLNYLTCNSNCISSCCVIQTTPKKKSRHVHRKKHHLNEELLVYEEIKNVDINYNDPANTASPSEEQSVDI